MTEKKVNPQLTILRRDFFISFVILFTLLTMNFFSWQLTKIVVGNNTREQFQDESEYLTKLINNRLYEYSEALEFGEKFYNASTEVERDEFQHFFSEFEGDQYVGIDGIYFIEKITEKGKVPFIEKVRKDKSLSSYGYPYFNIQSPEKRSTYSVVNYIVPFEKNKALFGYDFESDPQLREILDKSVELGKPVGSFQMQIMNSKRILMVKALYDNNKPARTYAQRIEALKGYIVVMLYPDMLFDKILSEESKKVTGGISFAVYDGQVDMKATSQLTPLYEDSNEAGEISRKDDLFTDSEHVMFLDRPWTVLFTSNPKLKKNPFELMMPDILFYATSILSFFMFALLSNVIQKYVAHDDELEHQATS